MGYKFISLVTLFIRVILSLYMLILNFIEDDRDGYLGRWSSYRLLLKFIRLPKCMVYLRSCSYTEN